ncbi:MAG: efflux RND transporter periplasmic adaptor subunit [Chlorobiaceae bacterium]|nr:efflux RND transporter periplasmic adaptor subunit [Chlorobiaceae bacterium]NTV61653.1 efflux RND transporter periplasmic adaptor subunit [Chlorobiaceae bacterium]
MKSLQSFLPKYSFVLAIIFIATVMFLIFRGNTVDIEAGDVTNAELVQAIYATGFIEAEAVANLSAEYSGTVSHVGAREGEHVAVGQKIVELDSQAPLLALKEARAAIAEQQAAAVDNRRMFVRKGNLFREGAISRQELEDSEKNRIQSDELLQQKIMQLKQREDELKKLSVRAPFAGVLTQQNFKKGDYVQAGSLVATVVDPANYTVCVEVDELDIPRIRNGQQATVALDAYPEKRIHTVVTRIVPQTDKVTKTSKIYLALTGDAGNIQAGMTATANIIYNTRPNAILVRKSSVFEENHRSYVWKIDDGRLKKQAVRTGAGDMTFFEVLSGLRKGDRVALVPKENLREGMQVRILKTGKS